MTEKIFRIAKLLGALVLVSQCASTLADQESDWIELREGYREKIIGARVDQINDVEDAQGNNDRQITIAIPKDAIKDTDDIYEIVVTGKAPIKDDEPVTLKIHHEWADDYDNDYYGLILTIGDFTELPIRLYFKGDTEAP